MKKAYNFNLRKPDVRTGFLNGGKGQEVSYLLVDPELNLASLAEDVKNGAKQFKELLTLAEKKNGSRFVVIDVESEEEGLMAVQYLSSIYNDKDNVDEEDYSDDIDEESNIEFEDFDEDPFGFEDDDDDWEDEAEWEETPWKIPIVSMEQVVSMESAYNPFNNGDMRYISSMTPREKMPFWFYTRHEPICLMNNATPFYRGIPGQMANRLKRFSKNRHVYIVNVHDREWSPYFVESDQRRDMEQQDMCEVILEYSAMTVKIGMEKADRADYYQKIFKDFVAYYGKKLAKDFPTQKVVKKIVDIRNSAKASLIEKVIKYALMDENVGNELTEDDFNILDKFKALGVFNKIEKPTLDNLDNKLIGMDYVKDQMRGIVEVLRYQKRREKMGLPKGDYHNVHMLLGAPGTAKTTVAQMLGEIMSQEKLLRANRFISVNGAELKGMYVGHSAPKVKALFDNYDVILIDEAYSVAAGVDGQSDSFSQEAIAQLILELEKHGTDRLVLFAGYGGDKMNERDNKMKKFLEANPGIRSRINSTILFESYSPEQMVDIFLNHAKQSEYTVEAKAKPYILEYFKKRVTDADFGNGREARSLVENATMEAAKRLAKLPESKITRKMMTELKLADIEKAIEKADNGYLAQKSQKNVKLGFAV